VFLQLRDYLQRVHKTKEMNVRDFISRIETICFLAQALPQSEGMDLLDDHEVVQVAFHGCPLAWHNEFKKQQHSLQGATLADIRSFMGVREELNPPPSSISNNNSSSNNLNTSNQGNQRSNRSNR
jgi:hypothetical protein